MSAVDDLLNKAVRRDLRQAQDKMAEAIKWQCEPSQRRAAKSIALYTSKLFCPHTFVQARSMVVYGKLKFSYKCTVCKAYNLSDTKL